MSAARAEAYWAGFLGVAPAALRGAGSHFVAHAGLGSWNGVWVFRRGHARVVSAPRARLGAVRAALGDLAAEALDDAARLGARLGRPAASVIGPACWGRLDPRALRPGPDPRVRGVSAGDPDDAAAVASLRAASGGDWEASGIDAGRMPLVGAFEGGRLLALAAWRARGTGVGDPCLLTAPDARGRGLASAAARAICADALARGELVLFQTLVANAPATAVARRLGFVPDARHVAIRLGGPA